MRKIIFSYVLLNSIISYSQEISKEIRPNLFSVTTTMIRDVVDPPSASRYYAYTLMAPYLILELQNEKLTKLEDFLKDFSITPPKLKKFDFEKAALYSILEIAKQFLPSGYLLNENQEQLRMQWIKNGLKPKELKNITAAAEWATEQILIFSQQDGYSRLSALKRLSPSKEPGKWYPTPPAYLEAIQPHWSTLKPIFITELALFAPAAPTVFSTDPNAPFYKQMEEVYLSVKNVTQEQRLIAAFWDCNPFAIDVTGHMMVGYKKMSPGGHWMNIAALVCEQRGLSFSESIKVQMLAGMTLMDAFISCWGVKYLTNRIRPETVINRYLDKEWMPILQTPPFPEYTSGHSVISTAVSEVLTYLIGDHIAFEDDSEILFDLPARHFSSFREAASEAAISRLYGGIHFRDAIEMGQQQGRDIANFILKILREKNLNPVN